MSKSAKTSEESYMVFTLCGADCQAGCTKHGYRWGPARGEKSGEKPYWQDAPPTWVREK